MTIRMFCDSPFNVSEVSGDSNGENTNRSAFRIVALLI